MERQQSKKVYQYDGVTGAFIKQYNSSREAARITGLNRWNLQDTLNNHPHYLRGGYKFSYKAPDKTTKIDKAHKMPMILFIDIETAPCTSFVWQTGKQFVSAEQIITDRFVFCWSAKWLYSNKVFSACVTSQEAKERDDSRIIKAVHKVINSADIIIAHNGKRFDMPIIKTRFLVHGLPPTSPYQFVDTYNVAKKEFKHVSNKLAWIQKSCSMTEKIHTSYQLWVRCFYGEGGALKEMRKYNENDVLILEENYLRIRPFIKQHPNLGLYICEPSNPESRCPNCGAIIEKKNWSKQFYYTAVAKYSVFVCPNCGNQGHSRFTALSKKEREVLVTACAR